MVHDRQVVGDEQVGELELVLELDQKVEHLRLDRKVQRRDRLVEDDDFGLSITARAMAMRCRWPPGTLRIAPRMLGAEAHWRTSS